MELPKWDLNNTKTIKINQVRLEIYRVVSPWVRIKEKKKSLKIYILNLKSSYLLKLNHKSKVLLFLNTFSKLR